MNAVVSETLIAVGIAAPFVSALVLPAFGRWPNLREAVTVGTAVLICATTFGLLGPVLAGARPETAMLKVAPGLDVAFAVEPLGMLFALVASGLWLVNSIYSIGYMRAHDEPRQTSFYVCFAVAIGSAIGIAYAKNLFTLFIFYEVLTLSTYPLVTHRRDPSAMRAGRLYLVLLLSASMLLFLPAIIATWFIGGTLNFTPGGILARETDPLILGGLLTLYAFGIGKAALMPVHFWLPAAMVAPTPVSAFLHAVAVVKAGVFTIVKVVIYVFGIDTLAASGANKWLVVVACISLLLASYVALLQDDLKARLAYSTVSQLAYVVLGAALATGRGITGSGLHVAMHAAGKITLFFCAGALYIAAHKTKISELDGIGRRMPVTMTAFLLGSLSIVGLPPFGGLWSKWTLLLGALDAGSYLALGALLLGSLMSAAYLFPIVARAFFVAPEGATGVKEAPLPCLIALCATAILSCVLFFLADSLSALLAGIPLR